MKNKIIEGFFNDDAIKEKFQSLENAINGALNKDIEQILTTENLTLFNIDNDRDNWLKIWNIYSTNGNWDTAPSIRFEPYIDPFLL